MLLWWACIVMAGVMVIFAIIHALAITFFYFAPDLTPMQKFHTRVLYPIIELALFLGIFVLLRITGVLR